MEGYEPLEIGNVFTLGTPAGTGIFAASLGGGGTKLITFFSVPFLAASVPFLPPFTIIDLAAVFLPFSVFPLAPLPALATAMVLACYSTYNGFSVLATMFSSTSAIATTGRSSK